MVENDTTHDIKVLENTQSKLRRLNIEAVTRMDDCFIICQYKREEPTNIEISNLFLGGMSVLGVKQVSLF